MPPVAFRLLFKPVYWGDLLCKKINFVYTLAFRSTVKPFNFADIKFWTYWNLFQTFCDALDAVKFSKPLNFEISLAKKLKLMSVESSWFYCNDTRF